MTNRVDRDRLWSRLMAMAEVGPAAHGGSNRQAISDEDAAGRALLLDWATAAGCIAETDEIGNLFIRRPGRDNSLPPVMVGSHLDTQPTGGRFDGVYGVLGGFEVIESLNDMSLETEAPIELVVWTNEEGSRFQYSMMGSAVWAGHLELKSALDLVDTDGLSVAEELNRLGWSGARPATPRPFTAAFELHIEQGPILEAEETDIGVVTGVQGFRWYTIRITGDEAHAGPTPMEVRHDPAAAISRIINDVYATAADLAPWGRATFAQFRSEPISPNTVPGVLTCSLDLRHPELAKLNEAEDRMRAGVAAAAAATGVKIEITVDNDSPPVAFNDECIAAVQASVDELGMSNKQMVSGAGHDACYVALRGPTSMIFVPCDGGVSHNEAENITSEQAERGASVLLGAVLRTPG
jgi:N-carbamoyl-L-amino-acid hydrolase